MSRRVRAEVLAQALAERFEDQAHWEWNEVADWLVEVFLPTEARLGRLKPLLDLEGATCVSYDAALDPPTPLILAGLGLRAEVRREHGRIQQVLIRDPT